MKGDAVTALTDSSGEQALCKACGLCCRGVWFSQVAIETEDLDRARELGLSVEIDQAGTAFFRQPCTLHKNGQCSAYDRWRPQSCVTYRCALLDRVRDNVVSLPAAMELVQAARAIADQLRPETTATLGGIGGSEFSLRRIPSTDPWHVTTREALSAEQKLAFASLSVYYVRHFKSIPKPDNDADEASSPSETPKPATTL